MSKRNPFDEKREIFRKLLIKERKGKNITQMELSKKLNKPQSFVSKYENGERNLDFVEIYQICIELNTNLENLVTQFKCEVVKF
jgi:transcriptional regulator with XRE-family HTH domain